MRTELEHLPSPNWFHHGEEILALLEEHRPKVCVELGSNRGCSAIAVARLVRQWGGHLTCVDQWQIGASEVGVSTFVDNITAAGVSGSINIMKMKTVEASKRWAGNIDYLYVDADHTFEGCTLDLELWWPFLRIGGLIAGDDYDDPHGDPVIGVTAAWDAFERARGQAFERVVTAGGQLAGGSRLIWGVKR